MFSRLFTSLFCDGVAIAIASFAPASAIPQDRSVPRSQMEDLLGGASDLAEGSQIRPLSTLGLGLIKEFEGWISHPYDDAGGYCTIGYGHLIALRACAGLELRQFGRGLTEAEGRTLLERDTRTARKAIQEAVHVELTDGQFGALSSFVYNISKERFMRSTMRKLLNLNALDLAAGKFSRWIRVAGSISEGLIQRRNCEQALFRGELSLDREGPLQSFPVPVSWSCAAERAAYPHRGRRMSLNLPPSSAYLLGCLLLASAHAI